MGGLGRRCELIPDSYEVVTHGPMMEPDDDCGVERRRRELGRGGGDGRCAGSNSVNGMSEARC